MDIYQTIRQRRAIYPATFTPETISDEAIWKLLEAANWAPTHRKTEPWRFQVFSGSARSILGDYLASAYRETQSEDSFSLNKFNKIQKKVEQASHIIAIIVAYSGEDIIPHWEEEAAVACAVQNLWLAASAEGLGGYWSTPQTIIGQPAILDLLNNEHCMGLFYLGMPKPITKNIPGERKPIQDKVKWHQ